jgi:CTP:molybdopterin cytidylyltransferase MocA
VGVVLAAGFSSRMGAFKPLLPLGPESDDFGIERGTPPETAAKTPFKESRAERATAEKQTAETVAPTALARCVRCLRAAGVADVLVVVGHHGDETAAAARAQGARVVRNPDPTQGMFSSVRAAFAALAAPADKAAQEAGAPERPPKGREAAALAPEAQDPPRTALVLPVDIPLVRPATIALLLADHFAAQRAIPAPQPRATSAATPPAGPTPCGSGADHGLLLPAPESATTPGPAAATKPDATVACQGAANAAAAPHPAHNTAALHPTKNAAAPRSEAAREGARPGERTEYEPHAAPAARVLTYPRFLGERGHPPVIDAALFDAVLAHDGAGGLRAVLAAWEEAHPESVGEVDVADTGVAMDMDRPEDYAAARAHLASPGPTEAECRALWGIASTPENVRAHCRAVAEAALRMALALNAARARRGAFAEGAPETEAAPGPASGKRTGAHGAMPPAGPATPAFGAAATGAAATPASGATASEGSVPPPSRAKSTARPQPPAIALSPAMVLSQGMALSPDAARHPHAACPLDTALVFGAALAHDVAKALPRHARAGADLLARHGFAEAAAIVADHADLELAADAPLTEREIVFLADKYVRGVEVVDMEERYTAKLERFGDAPDARAAVAGRLARAAEVRRRFLEESGARLPDLLLGDSPEPDAGNGEISGPGNPGTPGTANAADQEAP